MKNSYKALAILAAATLSAGCSSYDETNDPARAGNTSVKLLADVADDAETRAGISVGESTFTGYWEDNDAMGVLFTAPGSSPELRPFTYNDSDFAFEGELPAQTGAWQYMAFYPHATVNGTKASIPFGNLRTQIGNTAVRPVYAAEDGTVSATQLWDGHTTDERSMQSYGNYVDIRHADYKQQSLVTRYAHLFKFIVAKGEKVKEGQLIGYSGATGNVFGAHLHFEVLLGGKRTNPLTWLDDDFTTASSSVYTYGPGEHAVERPVEDKPAASTLQTICASNLTNAQAMAVFSLAIQLQLVAMRLYWAEFSDAEMAHQNIEVGPITQGDAKAVLDKLSAVGAKGTAQAA